MKKIIFVFVALSIITASIIALVPGKETNRQIAVAPTSRKTPHWHPLKTYMNLKSAADEMGYEGVWLDFDVLPKKRHYWKRLKNFVSRKNQRKAFLFHNFFSFHSKAQVDLLPRGNRVLVMWEPPSVLLSMYGEKVQRLFDKVLTWNDDLVDGKKYFKMFNPDLRPMEEDLPSFEERKLLCMIASNYKFNDFEKELYTTRREIARFFDSQDEGVFDLYGRLWEGYRHAKGRIPKKLETLKQYKFNICFENAKLPGYITEKIFDCFVTGTIPIYYGATNIKRYIPSGCFLDYRQFKNSGEMLTYIQHLSKEEYHEYIANIRTFLESEEAQRFDPDVCAKNIIDAIGA